MPHVCFVRGAWTVFGFTISLFACCFLLCIFVKDAACFWPDLMHGPTSCMAPPHAWQGTRAGL